MQRSILITGAAGGVGGALVARALARGDRVFAAARRLEQLEAVSLTSSCTALAMEVGDDASVEAAFAELDLALDGRPLDAVIHAAAVAPHSAVELTTPKMFQDVLNVNTVGTFRVLRAAIPRLRASKGRCVLISSLWSRTGGPLLASYAASKHAVGALADATRRETHGQGLSISLVELGVVATPMLTRQRDEAASSADLGRYAGLYASYHALVRSSEKTALSADAAASQIERILSVARPKARYRVGSDAKAVALLTGLLPDSALDALFAALIKA